MALVDVEDVNGTERFENTCSRGPAVPDISMCRNFSCQRRVECYRFRAVPSPIVQAFADFKCNEEDGCAYFMPLWPGDHVLDIDENGHVFNKAIRLPTVKPDV